MIPISFKHKNITFSLKNAGDASLDILEDVVNCLLVELELLLLLFSAGASPVEELLPTFFFTLSLDSLKYSQT